MGMIIYTLGCQVSDFGIFDVVRVVHMAAVFLAKDHVLVYFDFCRCIGCI